MIITCDKCKAKYMVPPHSLGAEGRSVKCAKCGNTWFAKPTAEEIEKAKFSVSPPKDHPTHDHSKLPALTNHKNILILKIIPAVLTLVILFFMTLFCKDIITIIPGAEHIYESQGIFSTENVAFRSVAIRKIETMAGRNMIIKGEIYNGSNRDKILPNIRFIMLDGHGNQIRNFTEHTNKSIIKAGDVFSFNFTITPLDDNAEILKLDLGNKLDLFLRG